MNRDSSFESQVEQLLNLCYLHRVVWISENKFSSPEKIASDLIEYLESGKNKAYSHFWTYKASEQIVGLISENQVLGLVSNDILIRAISQQLLKRNSK